MKKCPFCAEEILDEAVKCKHCGEFLEGARQKAGLKPGDRTGSYLITKELGRGGMAEVFLAEDTGLSKSVALKVLPPQFIHDPEVKRRFKSEAQIAARLIHPGIVTIHTVSETSTGQPFFVMEYLPGQSLSAILRQGPLGLANALDICDEILSALDYAHGKGVIHRDIKADNILFRESGTVVIADFGIAKAVQSTQNLTSTGVLLGTPHYMSPEQCRGESLDARSDLYSVGVLLFQMVTGKLPFNGEGFPALIYAHLREPPPVPSSLNTEIPAWLDDVVLRALAKEPGERFPTAIAFREAIVTNVPQYKTIRSRSPGSSREEAADSRSTSGLGERSERPTIAPGSGAENSTQKLDATVSLGPHSPTSSSRKDNSGGRRKPVEQPGEVLPMPPTGIPGGQAARAEPPAPPPTFFSRLPPWWQLLLYAVFAGILVEYGHIITFLFNLPRHLTIFLFPIPGIAAIRFFFSGNPCAGELSRARRFLQWLFSPGGVFVILGVWLLSVDLYRGFFVSMLFSVVLFGTATGYHFWSRKTMAGEVAPPVRGRTPETSPPSQPMAWRRKIFRFAVIVIVGSFLWCVLLAFIGPKLARSDFEETVLRLFKPLRDGKIQDFLFMDSYGVFPREEALQKDKEEFLGGVRSFQIDDIEVRPRWDLEDWVEGRYFCVIATLKFLYPTGSVDYEIRGMQRWWRWHVTDMTERSRKRSEERFPDYVFPKLPGD